MNPKLLLALPPLFLSSSCHAAPAPILKTAASSTKPHAPIPVQFTLKQKGFVTLVVEGMSGKRVRNLISETPFEAGQHTIYWDGLDDLGRDPEAAERGVYRAVGKLVEAGNYRVRGLVRPEIELRYALTPYTHGNPPWQSADASSGWLANHSAPSSTLFVPAGRDGKPQIMVGSPLSEGGSALAWLDLNGKKVFGVGHVGGIFSGAATLARDNGQRAVPDVYAYSATAWEGELRLYAWDKSQNAKPVLVPSYGERNLKLRGLAVHNGLVVASLGDKLLFVDASSTKELGTLPVPDARGVAFDLSGRLLVLSGSQLVRHTLPPDIKPFLNAPANYGEPLEMKGWTARASSTAEHRARLEWAFDGDSTTRWASGQSQKPGDYFIIDMKAPRTFSGILLDSSGHQDHPAGWEIRVSNDGEKWSEPIASSANEKAGEFNSSIASTAGGVAQTRASFAPQTARYIKATLTKSLGWWWAINDLTVYNGAKPSTKASQTLPAPLVLTRDLENAQTVVVDEANSIYVSDWGNSHQVKVFDEGGKFVRAIGTAGAPKAGVYDSNHMNNPTGLTIVPGESPQLWVAESDLQPKRLSVWDTQTGKLVRAFYGPGRYGGGGSLDPQDKTRFYYDGMEFKLDWKTGASVPVNVFLRPDTNSLTLPEGYGASGTPETAIYLQNQRYLTNAFNSHPTNGTPVATIWMMRENVARPVAALGNTQDWKILQDPKFTARPAEESMFVWSDANADAQMQPGEVEFWRGKGGSVTVGRDLSFVASRVDERAVRWTPTRFTKDGVPVYDSKRGETLAAGMQVSPSSGGDQAIVVQDGWSILTTAPKPLSAYGIGGAKAGQALWSYPSLWPGLHASHRAPRATFGGQLLGTTRLLGNTITPKAGGAGEIWGINGNKGQVYLFTTDGLFIATLFQDSRTTSWSFPTAKIGMRVDEASLQEEAFFATMTQAPDGIYLQAGFFGNIVRVDGLEKIERLPSQTIRVTPQLLAQARDYGLKTEAERQGAEAAKQGPLVVAIRRDAPVVDGKIDEWTNAAFVPIDEKTSAAVAVSGDRLFAAFRTGDAKLLQNSGESTALLFKGGGALDLQLNTRESGLRLLVTQVAGKTRATLYRPNVPGTQTAKVKFSSPNRTVEFDRVDDVSSQVTLAGDGNGGYELSVPLSLLELKAEIGTTVAGDVGILRGNGFQTLQRVYWRNKASGLVSDVPGEAEMTPRLWGNWEFKTAQ